MECGLCFETCRQAGHNAISWVSVPEENGEGERLVPQVNPAKCVGCGLCEVTCLTEVVATGVLEVPAVTVTPRAAQVELQRRGRLR